MVGNKHTGTVFGKIFPSFYVDVQIEDVDDPVYPKPCGIGDDLRSLLVSPAILAASISFR